MYGTLALASLRCSHELRLTRVLSHRGAPLGLEVNTTWGTLAPRAHFQFRDRTRERFRRQRLLER